jgi:hypothetical protein
MSLPVACSLTTNELQERSQHVLQKVRAALVEIKELENGYAYRLPSDGAWIGELANLVNLERQCCLFLRFNIIVEPDNGPIWLELTGPSGTKDFLKSIFNLT